MAHTADPDRSAMFPISLDVALLPVAVVGNGAACARRVGQLREAGAAHLQVFAPEPIAALVEIAGAALVRRLPDAAEIRAVGALWTADLPRPVLETLAATARVVGTLVNTEDDLPLCDFHTPSFVRRGDLVLAVSTGGKSPALARRIRKFLQTQFGPEWAERLDRLAALRLAWRAEGLDMASVAARTEGELDTQGWLPKEQER
jgi:precorrin-2 dehydrogenase / sirohydrochlorin ferrochelatase